MIDKKILIASRKGLIIVKKESESNWVMDSVHFLGIPVSYSFVDPRNNRVWACLDHGHWGVKLHYSDNQGQDWQEVPAPVYPEGEEIKDGIPATTKYLWTMREGHPDRPDELWIGTEPGGLFRSRNNGKSWELVRGLWDHASRKESWFGAGRDYSGLHSILINPDNPNHLLVGVSVAGVFESTDDGTTWQPKNNGVKAEYLPNPDVEVGQDPHLLVAHPSDFNLMWQQNHCGIYGSINGGKSWNKLTSIGQTAHFGFAIVLDDKEPETAWVVPATSDETRVAVDLKLCVSKTTDGGKNWEDLRKGLPQKNAFDLVYRHSLDKSEGDIAFGTTTGNLYLSTDKGENWNCFSNNLPLIYSVRFWEL